MNREHTKQSTKRTSRLLALFLAFLISLGSCTAIIGVFSDIIAYASMSEIEQYYNGLNTNLTGDAFRAELTDLITDTHHTQTKYGGSGSTSLASVFKTADADPDRSGNILWFYTGTSVSFSGTYGSGAGATNREHVWPKNAGNAFPEESQAGSDAHHLRPTNAQLNSTRSNNSFGEVAQTSANIVKENGKTNYGVAPDGLCYQSDSVFYPAEGYRGATARILMYVQVRWGDDYDLEFVLGRGNNKTIGDIETLMKWHLEEPPTEEETRRNEAVCDIQGNRNPFIDHPEYAEMIYCYDGESYNDELRAVVAEYEENNGGTGGGTTPAPTMTSISLVGSPTRRTYTAGNLFDPTGLTVKALYSDGTNKTLNASECQWLDANTRRTILSEGTTSVICKYGSFEATVTGITVSASSSGDGSGSTEGLSSFVISRADFPGSVSYSWQTWTDGTISGRAFITGSNNTTTIQMNSSKTATYLYNTTALSGGVKKITIKLSTSTTQDKNFEILTSSTPYADASGVPTTGTSQGIKTIPCTGEEITWDIIGSDPYFTVNYKGTGAVYIDSIEIFYGESASTPDETPAEIKFSEASVTVSDSYRLNFYIPAALLASSAIKTYTVELSMGSDETVRFVNTQTAVKEDNLMFSYKGITPNRVGDAVTATLLYTTQEGSERIEMTYSIADYCYARLEGAENAEEASMLVDLLNYAAAAQLYTDYRTDALANRDLTDEEKALGTADVGVVENICNKEAVVLSGATVEWDSAFMTLTDSLRLAFVVRAQSSSGLSLAITVGTDTYTVNNCEDNRDGTYTFYFSSLGLNRMDQEIRLVAMKNGAAVSNTLLYSAASYVSGLTESSQNAELEALVEALLAFSRSINVWVN